MVSGARASLSGSSGIARKTIYREPAPSEGEAPAGASGAPESPGSDQEATFQKRGQAALDKIKNAAQKPGAAPAPSAGQSDATAVAALPQWFKDLQKALLLSTVWGPEQQEGQKVLQDYATYMLQKNSAKIPPNVQVFLQHLGESPGNDPHQGGRLPSGPNSCTGVTTQALKNALNTNKVPDGEKLWGTNAYDKPLFPGDMVMFLFKGAQYGGHTVTVAEDKGASFLHVSGNSTAGGVALSESKRLTAPPPGFDLNKATTVDTEEHKKAATEEISKYASEFGDKVLVYSIVRYSKLFEAPGGSSSPTN
jgi:hypothetical protein